MSPTDIQLLLRAAIVDKEAAVVSAKHDIAKYGEWQCDWESEFRRCSLLIDSYIDRLAEVDKTAVPVIEKRIRYETEW